MSEATKDKEPKKGAVVAKYSEDGRYIPGVPARDLTEDDVAEFDDTTMELLRQDSERDNPVFKHSKSLGHSERWKAEREREKEEKAKKADSEKGS